MTFFNRLVQRINENRMWSILTFLKLFILEILIIIPNLVRGTHRHLLIETVELIMIFLLFQLFGRKLKYLSYLISSLLFLLVISQEWIKFFSGNFLTKIMLDNTTNISALGPSLPLYFSMAALVIVIAFLPMKFDFIKGMTVIKTSIVALLFIFGFVVFQLKAGTVLVATSNLGYEYYTSNQIISRLNVNKRKKKKILASFKKSKINTGSNVNLNKPNVIVIFAEGTSRRVIEQSETRFTNLTPNISNFSNNSIDVHNYFNHTAPTYRGLRGQLYSSFQYEEGYEGANTAKEVKKRVDTKLIGLPEILNSKGYQTEFINPEPKHKTFTPYLNQLGFDKVSSGEKKDWSGSGDLTFLPDNKNLDLLFSSASSMKQPFFIGTYTLQTHNSWDVKDNQYGDGKNAVLNKFHNFDTAFGEFYKKFMNSPLKDNTILILTTDHASYASPDYATTMGDTRDAFASTIPLMIYYPGVKPQKLDAKGRNSLDLTPTLLDLLSIEKVDNYFLGSSLFTDKMTKFDRTTEVGSDFYSTKKGSVEKLNPDQNGLRNRILEFDSVSLNMTHKEE